MDHNPIQIGDLVVFCVERAKLKEGYFLWVDPDYEPKALDVQSVIKHNVPLVVIFMEKFDNVFVLAATGEFGWTRAALLRKII